MRNIVLVPLFLGMAFVGCDSQKKDSKDNQGSSLTSVDVNLPAKESLPKGLQGAGLSYCFSVRDVQTGVAYREGEPVCVVPYSTNQNIKRGLYEGGISLDLKLDSSKSYELSLVIGYEYAGPGGSSGVGVPTRAVTEFTEPGIDLDRLFYHGVKTVQSNEMQGKSNLKVSLKLSKFNSAGGEVDGGVGTIITPGTVDVEVEPIFVETEDSNVPTTT